MITVKQICAARALLNWSQQELAKAARIHSNVITNMERGASKPRQSTLRKLQRVLETKGVYFRGTSGLMLVNEMLQIHRFDGPDFMRFLTDDFVFTVTSAKHDVCAIVHDDTLFRQADALENARYYKHKQRVHFRDRIIVPTGFRRFLSKKTLYRFLPKSAIGETSWITYGDRLCHIVWDAHEVIIIRNQASADTFRAQFDFLWTHAKSMA